MRDVRRDNAFLITLQAQFSPIVPFGVNNYAAGASKLPYFAYTEATAIGIVPATIAAVYVGDRIAFWFPRRRPSRVSHRRRSDVGPHHRLISAHFGDEGEEDAYATRIAARSLRLHA